MTLTGNELIAWLRSPEAARRFAHGTTNTYISAVRAVLAVAPDGSRPIAEGEVEQLANEFRAQQTGRSRQTVETYVSSFKAAIKAFLQGHSDSEAGGPIAVEVRRWDFPLRPSIAVPLNLPVDLNPEEADRLAQFVRSLAIGSGG